MNVKGMDPNEPVDSESKSTILHLACQQNKIGVVRYLFRDSNANLRMLNQNGDDCLMIAIKKNYYALAEFLMTQTVKDKRSI